MNEDPEKGHNVIKLPSTSLNRHKIICWQQYGSEKSNIVQAMKDASEFLLNTINLFAKLPKDPEKGHNVIKLQSANQAQNNLHSAEDNQALKRATLFEQWVVHDNSEKRKFQNMTQLTRCFKCAIQIANQGAIMLLKEPQCPQNIPKQLVTLKSTKSCYSGKTKNCMVSLNHNAVMLWKEQCWFYPDVLCDNTAWFTLLLQLSVANSDKSLSIHTKTNTARF